MANDLTQSILDTLASTDRILSSDAFPSIPSSTIKGALDRLASRDMVEYETIDKEDAVLTEEGLGIAVEGSHEVKVFEAVRKAVEGLQISELSVRAIIALRPWYNA